MLSFNLTAIRKALAENDLDGWLFYDFQGSDPIGKAILNIFIEYTQTHRWYYFIPAQGVPIKIVHSMDKELLDHLPGKKEVYLGWREMEEKLESIFNADEKIARGVGPQPNRHRFQAVRNVVGCKFLGLIIGA